VIYKQAEKDNCNVLHLNAMKKLLDAYYDVFEERKCLPCLRSIQHSIELVLRVKLFNQPPYWTFVVKY